MMMQLARKALAAPLQLLIQLDDWLHPEPPHAPPASLRLPERRTGVRGKRKRRAG